MSKWSRGGAKHTGRPDRNYRLTRPSPCSVAILPSIAAAEERCIPPFDLGLVQATDRITHVVVLIDDIFDMYLRLAFPGRLFNWAEWVRDHLADAWSEQEGKGDPNFDEPDRSTLRLEARINVLQNLLSWRRSEVLLAEALATQLRARFLVFGVKQEARILARWLQDGGGGPSDAASRVVSTYLSHPVSGPRRHQRDTGLWPDVVYEFNELPDRLLEHGVSLDHADRNR